MTWKDAAESKPVVGSSKNNIFFNAIHYVAIYVLRFSPPEIPLTRGVPMCWFSTFVNPNSCIKVLIHYLIKSFGYDLSLLIFRAAAYSMHSLTERLPIKTSSCIT